jgi:guanylate kinase
MTPFTGKSIIVSAPSGAGKTTIVKYLLEHVPGLTFSVSTTSRPARPNEIDGEDYHFVSTKAFRKAIDAGEFAEWEEVYPGRYYGTPKSELIRIWNMGHHIIFDLDVVGGANLKNYFRESALSIFVSPPDMAALEMRLRNRRTETEETLKVRLEKAAQEMAFKPKFDKVVVNDLLDKACVEAEALVRKFLIG